MPRAGVSSLSMSATLDDPMAGLFTSSSPEDRRVSVPTEELAGRPTMKIVYVVLESQYQSAVTKAVENINADASRGVAVECVGYLLEELRSEETMKLFEEDVKSANVFIGSLIFIQEIADKIIEIVKPERDNLDAVLIFPSMPEVGAARPRPRVSLVVCLVCAGKRQTAPPYDLSGCE